MKIRPPSEAADTFLTDLKGDPSFMAVLDKVLKPMGVTPAKFFDTWRPRFIKNYTAKLKKEVHLTVESQKKVLAGWKKEKYPEGAWK